MPTPVWQTLYRAEQQPELLRPWLTAAHGLRWQQTQGNAPARASGELETRLGTGFLAERRCRYRVDYAAQSIRLRVGAELDCQIAADGSTVELIQAQRASLESLLGPPLLLTLARRGIHCLHASAARAPTGEIVLFSAASGTGKSTLARVAAANGWQRLADDLSPVSQNAELLPRFPQLKLGPWPQPLPPALPLTRLVMLRRGERSALRSLSPSESARALLAASVGARMYSERMCSDHFHWATGLATSLGSHGACELTLVDSPRQPETSLLAGLERLLEFWR